MTTIQRVFMTCPFRERLAVTGGARRLREHEAEDLSGGERNGMHRVPAANSDRSTTNSSPPARGRLDLRQGGRWRRQRDSNPWYTHTYNRFRVCRNRPLCHLSAADPAQGGRPAEAAGSSRSEEHTSELQSPTN